MCEKVWDRVTVHQNTGKQFHRNLRSELHRPNTNLQSRLASAPSLGWLSRLFWTRFRTKGQKDSTCTWDHKQHQIFDKVTAKAMNRDAIFHQFHRAKTHIRIWKLRTTKCLKRCQKAKPTGVSGRNKRTSNPTPFLWWWGSHPKSHHLRAAILWRK